MLGIKFFSLQNIRCIRLSFQIVGNKLFTGSHDGCLRVWDITEETKKESLFGDDRPPVQQEPVKKRGELDGNQNIENGQDTRIMIEEEEMNGGPTSNGGEGGDNNGYLRDNSHVF